MSDLDAIGAAARNLGYIIAFLSTIATLFVGWLFYRLKDKFVTRDEHNSRADKIDSVLKEHDQRLDSGQQRFADLKSDMKNFATKADVHKVELAVKELEGDVKAIGEAVNGIRSTLEFLVDQHGKAK